MKARPGCPRINGRRGAFQLLFAFIHFFIGISFIGAPAASRRTTAIGDLDHWIAPLVALWLISAGLAVVSAFYCRPRDRFGFTALVVAPGILPPGGSAFRRLREDLGRVSFSRLLLTSTNTDFQPGSSGTPGRGREKPRQSGERTSGVIV